MSSELRLLTTVGNQAEAEMVMERLAESGIRSMPHLRADDIRLGPAAPLDIYVEPSYHAQALEVLGAEVPSEAELEELSQEGAPEDA